MSLIISADFILNNNASLGYRQSNKSYSFGDIAYHSNLPTGYYLECTTAGTSSSGNLTISGTITPNVTVVTDGTVVWTIRQTASTKNLTGFLIGNLKTDTNLISSNDDNYIMIICGDNNYDSPFIFMNGNNGDGSVVKGRIVLNAQDLTESTMLILDPNGELLLDNSSNIATDLGAAAIVAKSLSNSGYIKYASGLTLQWGLVSVASGATVSVTFPIAFPTINTLILANIDWIGMTVSATPYAFVETYNNESFNVKNCYPGSAVSVMWFAIGY